MFLATSPPRILVVEDDPAVPEVVAGTRTEGWTTRRRSPATTGRRRGRRFGRPASWDDLFELSRLQAGALDLALERMSPVARVPVPDLPPSLRASPPGGHGRTRRDAGAGLGPAVARGLVEAHGGETGVKNGGDGCRFAIRLSLVAG